MNKELEELKYLDLEQVVYVYKDYWNEIQKKLKALKIIKEKLVLNDRYLMSGSLDAYNRYARACQKCSAFKPEELTQEEFDLLKEVLL